MKQLSTGTYYLIKDEIDVIPKRCIIREVGDDTVTFDCQYGAFLDTECPKWYYPDPACEYIVLSKSKFEADYLPYLYEKREDFIVEIREKSRKDYDTREKVITEVARLVESARKSDIYLIGPERWSEFRKRVSEELPEVGAQLRETIDSI